MKIAAIIITYNDGYKFKEWCRWYEEYRDELYKLIIVDNGSEPEYIQQVETYFKDAIIIKRSTNGGCTIAYNDGIRVALSDPNVTHITLIGNDIRISKGGLSQCADTLDLDNELGMVAPVLLRADSDIVVDFGCSINEDFTLNPFGKGLKLVELSDNIRYCDAVTGGMNIAKRSFYESTVGLQDENLFMYSDEVDMGLRARSAGVKMASIRNAQAWHQHINSSNSPARRHPFNKYLIARNKTYLANKYKGKEAAKRECWYFVKKAIHSIAIDIIKCRWGKVGTIRDMRWQIIGAINGLMGNMKPNKFSHL